MKHVKKAERKMAPPAFLFHYIMASEYPHSLSSWLCKNITTNNKVSIYQYFVVLRITEPRACEKMGKPCAFVSLPFSFILTYLG